MAQGTSLVELLVGALPWLKRRATLRARWGMPGEGDAAGAAWYFDLTRKLAGRAAVVDDKTWSDLELPRFFTGVDTTLTPIARQYLFAQLRTYEYADDEIDRRYHAYEALRSNQELRENLRLALRPLATDSAAHMPELLLGPEPERVPLQTLVIPCMLLAIAAIPLAILHLLPVWLCAIPFLINAL